jgi:DNA-binding transcriptional LysR family regulator
MLDRKWLPLNALRAFEAVAKKTSFTAGAHSLSVTQSAISRHVSSLEDLLGKKLFERRPSGLVLTEAGQKLLPVVERSFDRIEKTMNELKQESAKGLRTLRIHMPPTFLQRLGMQLLHEFRVEFPDINVDVSSTYGNGMPNRDIDVAVIYDKPRISDAIMDVLWMERVTPVCSPDLAQKYKDRPLEQLLADNELLHVRIDGQPNNHLWTQFSKHARIDLDTARGVTFDTLALAVQYASRGYGVVLCDIDMYAEDIDAGLLGIPAETEIKDGFGYFLVLNAEDLEDPLISLFRNWIITRFAAVDRRSLATMRAGVAGAPAAAAANPARSVEI